MGGALGHDSMEDSTSTGDLVRYVVGKEWAKLKREGWRIQAEQLMPPLPSGLPPPPPSEDQEPSRVLGGGSGIKRQRIQMMAGESVGLNGAAEQEHETKRQRSNNDNA